MTPNRKPCDCHPDNPRPRYKNVKEDGEVVHYCKTGYFSKYPPAPIPKESKRRKRERPIYTNQKNKALEERPYCELRIPGVCTRLAQGMQHKKGRTGKLYLDMEHQLTSCNACNTWAADHPEQAIELGISSYRNRKAG